MIQQLNHIYQSCSYVHSQQESTICTVCTVNVEMLLSQEANFEIQGKPGNC